MSVQELAGLIRAEEEAHRVLQQQWDRIAVVRALLKDAEFAEMLGVSQDALALAFARVHKDQKAAEETHFELMDRVAELATAVES